MLRHYNKLAPFIITSEREVYLIRREQEKEKIIFRLCGESGEFPFLSHKFAALNRQKRRARLAFI
jgi:hypothetical protein